MRNYFHLSIALLLVVQLCPDWTTARLEPKGTVIHSPFLRDLVELVDGEFLRLSTLDDIESSGYIGFILRLVRFDWSGLGSVLYSHSLWGVENILPERASIWLRTVVSKLEYDVSTIEEIVELLDMLGLPTKWFIYSIEVLDEDLREIADEVLKKMESRKIKASDTEKLLTLLYRVDWQEYMNDVESSVYKKIEKSLTLHGRKHLHSFLDQLTRGQPLDKRFLEYAITKMMHKVHSFIQKQAALFYITIKEKTYSEIHEELKWLGVYKAVEQSLSETMFFFANPDKGASGHKSWNDIKSLPDVEKLAEIIVEVDYTKLGQKLYRYVFYLMTSDFSHLAKMALHQSKEKRAKRLKMETLPLEFMEALLDTQTQMKEKFEAKRRGETPHQENDDSEAYLNQLEREMVEMYTEAYDDAKAKDKY